MTPRPYRLGRRQEGVDETRGRILDAARGLLASDGYREFTVDTVAREADVSRATVYYQFGSKAGLLAGLFDDRAARGRMSDLAEAFQETDPLARLKEPYEAIGRIPAFAGLCYTQLTDVEQEVNGLLTYDRKPEFDANEIKAINDLVQ